MTTICKCNNCGKEGRLRSELVPICFNSHLCSVCYEKYKEEKEQLEKEFGVARDQLNENYKLE